MSAGKGKINLKIAAWSYCRITTRSNFLVLAVLRMNEPGVYANIQSAWFQKDVDANSAINP